ncbi:hypothetical protein [Paraburkholderia youngii]|uniref:hypothetical protein n=1 Tax=Paraburkholderia youngii TaxID=2782701 RepID=UPI003D1C8132
MTVDAYPSLVERFRTQLNNAIETPDLLLATRSEREGLSREYDMFHSRGIGARYKPATRSISQDAKDLIVAFEVTDQKRYEARYQRPIWPGGNSGITIGIGYDLGWATSEWLRSDWTDRLAPEHLALLSSVCGKTGENVQPLLTDLQSIQIPWVDAFIQFNSVTLPRYIAETLAVADNVSKLSDDSLGALVSLDYNRGQNFRTQSYRYVEMNAIYRSLVTGNFADIPAQIRKMKRLWEGISGARGLVIRRELEAVLFEKGLEG